MLKLNQETNEITYHGVVVGHIEVDRTRHTVSLKLEYSSDDMADGIVIGPLAELATLLAAMEPPPPLTVLTVGTGNDDIGEVFPVPQSLMEFWLKGQGYKWDFHMTDSDPWPSRFHAHDYAKNLKMDVITGEIFDASTKQRVAKLKAQALKKVHTEVRKSSALSGLVATYLPPPPPPKPKAKKKPPLQQQR